MQSINKSYLNINRDLISYHFKTTFNAGVNNIFGAFAASNSFYLLV
jgi:hypothetical protein